MGANAQTTVPSFLASQVLTADQMNQSARTGVPVFATTVERDAAFGGAGEKVLAEGQLCYLEDANVVQYYDSASWATVGPSASGVVQVKSTAKTDTFTTSSATFTDITGLSVSITPTSASNKILVIATYHDSYTANENGFTRLMRDSTAIAVGDAAGSRPQCTAMIRGLSADDMQTNGIAFLDSPATTSATTYKVQAQCSSSAHTYFLNRTNNDSDGASRGRSASTITVMEVTP